MKKLLTLLMAVVALLASPGATAAPTNDEINAAILAEGQSALTWENDPTYPWTVVDGVMQSTNAGHPNTEARLTAKLKLDRLTRIKYYYSPANNTSHMALSLYVNGKKVRKHSNQSSNKWYNDVIVLPAGEHTLSWQCDIADYNWDELYYRLKDIKVAQDWIEVNSTAGTLGDEVLKKTDILQNVRMLKVTGAMNSTDWDKIALMTNLNAIDLSETNIEEIIENAFKNNPLKYVVLPKNTKTIRQNAFYDKDIYSIDLPSSVTTIESYAFESSSLIEFNIPDNTSLTSIGEGTFYGTNLTRFLMPNTVTSLGSSAFSNCTSLTELTFSENLTSIPSSCCLYNKNITKLKIPTKVTSIGRSAFQDLSIDSIVLPKKLVDLGESAFYGCDSLRYVEIPTGIHNLDYVFNNCKNIETIVCKSPTPPTISQPFSDQIQSTATLRIPKFAMEAYLQDPYWYKFKNINTCDAEDYWAVGGQLTLAEGQRMEGTPDLNIFSEASVTINGNQAANFNSVTFNTDGGYYYNSKSGVLINNCPNATAKSAVIKMTIKKDRWYFITPLFDIARANITAEGIHNIAIREYDAANRATNGTGDNWKNIGNNDLKAGHGYIIRC